MTLFRSLSEDGNEVVLKRLKEFKNVSNDGVDKKDIGHLLVLDVETTGLSHSDDKMTELGMGLFSFNKKTGEIYKLLNKYNAYSDPGMPISEFITELTGITDEMVKGKKFDYETVRKFFQHCDVVIAHNAFFDRGFIERDPELLEVSCKKIWCCSGKQVDWKDEGYEASKQTTISWQNGFFIDAHKAFNDVLALTQNIRYKAKNEKTFLYNILQDAKKKYVEAYALNSDFKHKDLLKNNGFLWNDTSKLKERGVTSPNGKGLWSKLVCENEIDEIKKIINDGMGFDYCSKNLNLVIIPRERRFV